MKAQTATESRPRPWGSLPAWTTEGDHSEHAITIWFAKLTSRSSDASRTRIPRTKDKDLKDGKEAKEPPTPGREPREARERDGSDMSATPNGRKEFLSGRRDRLEVDLSQPLHVALDEPLASVSARGMRCLVSPLTSGSPSPSHQASPVSPAISIVINSANGHVTHSQTSGSFSPLRYAFLAVCLTVALTATM